MSLMDDECKWRLGERRKVLLRRYTSATKVALLRSKFMGTTSLVVLQALVIYLLAVRDVYEPRAVWSLTGVALRIAQSMGLERDGVDLGLPPFETEMRRRIWWQLKMHDFRTAELCGMGKFQDLHGGAERTKWPTNIDDDQLYPGMALLATESNKLTDAVFVSMKCELLNYAANSITNLRQQGRTSSPWDPHPRDGDAADIDGSFREIEELLENKYIRYCDASQPLHLMAMLMARSSINIICFMLHHPRRWASQEETPLSERRLVWEICIRLLEQHNMLQSNPILKQFAWHASYYQQWHAIIHILDSLRADPLNPDADKAWKYIATTYENNPDMVFDMRKPIHLAVGNLCVKTYANCEAALQNKNSNPSPAPQFISQLRKKLQVVEAKRSEHYLKSGQPGDLINNVPAGACNTGQRPGVISDGDNDELSHNLDATDPKQGITLEPQSITPGSSPASSERNAFWRSYGLDDVQGDRSATHSYSDFILNQDYGVGSSDTHTISWDDWDSWLADSNLMRPLP